MDKTHRPLVIPPPYAMYAEKHKLFDLFKELMEQLLLNKPQDPLLFLKELLDQENYDVPKIVILGPPVSGKRSLSEQIAKKLRCPLLRSNEVIEQTSRELSDEVQKCKTEYNMIPSELWVRLLKERCSRVDCVRKGWVLEGFPQTRDQALCLQAAGLSPKHVLTLDLSEEEVVRRAALKKIDDRSGDPYIEEFNWPSDSETLDHLITPMNYDEAAIRLRCAEFGRQIEGLKRCYQPFLRSFDGTVSQQKTLKSMMDFVQSRQRTGTPMTPRIVLLGPPGSGKSFQAARLAAKYNLVNVNCEQIIRENLAEETKLGLAIKLYVEKKLQIPDGLALQMITAKLAQLDATTRGWILHGYPNNAGQAEQLSVAGFLPNRVFMLTIGLESVVERVTLRRIDPETGRRYHLLFEPPQTVVIRDRLVVHPDDNEEEVTKKYKGFLVYREELSDFYGVVQGDKDGDEETDTTTTGASGEPLMQFVNGDKDPHTVFETIESFLANPVPVSLI